MSTTPEALAAKLEAASRDRWAFGLDLAGAAAQLRRFAAMETQLAEFIVRHGNPDAIMAERDQLRAEAERTARNRDMWKAQCERQAAELEKLRRGESICGKCGLRQPGEGAGPVPF